MITTHGSLADALKALADAGGWPVHTDDGRQLWQLPKGRQYYILRQSGPRSVKFRLVTPEEVNGQPYRVVYPTGRPVTPEPQDTP